MTDRQRDVSCRPGDAVDQQCWPLSSPLARAATGGSRNYSWFDSLYATVTTITTVGGGEVRPFHTAGKLWTMVVVAIGFLVFTDAILTLVGFVIEGHLGHAFGERRTRQRIERMRDHFVLCGFGRIGREIAAEFAAEGSRS